MSRSSTTRRSRQGSQSRTPGPLAAWVRPHAGRCDCARCESAREIRRAAKAAGVPPDVYATRGAR